MTGLYILAMTLSAALALCAAGLVVTLALLCALGWRLVVGRG